MRSERGVNGWWGRETAGDAKGAAREGKGLRGGGGEGAEDQRRAAAPRDQRTNLLPLAQHSMAGMEIIEARRLKELGDGEQPAQEPGGRSAHGSQRSELKKMVSSFTG